MYERCFKEKRGVADEPLYRDATPNFKESIVRKNKKLRFPSSIFGQIFRWGSNFQIFITKILKNYFSHVFLPQSICKKINCQMLEILTSKLAKFRKSWWFFLDKFSKCGNECFYSKKVIVFLKNKCQLPEIISLCLKTN